MYCYKKIRLSESIEGDFVGKTHVLIMHGAKTAFVTKNALCG
jgi:hypothetical protein